MSSLLAKARQHNTRKNNRQGYYSSDDDDVEGGGSFELNNSSYTSHDSELSNNQNVSTAHNSTSRSMNKQQSSSAPAKQQQNQREEATEDYQLANEEQDGTTTTQSSNVYGESAHFKQNYAPFSTGFCIVQCIILPVMMWQCGVAPMNINPMIGPYPDALNYWGAKNAVLIIDDGEFWRLFTPIFLHAGLIHLGGNVMVQIDAGNTWEKEWGSVIWMIIYIGSAFGSSVLSTICMPDNISVGSSGAVMGLFGAKFSEIVLLCCEKSTNLRERSDERSRKQQAALVIGGIVIVALMSFIPYVDWAAHLGGMLAGFVLGLVCFSFKIRSWFFMLLWLVVGVGSCIALYSLGMTYMYTQVETNDELRDVCGYYKQYFDDYECQCMLDEAIEFGSWTFGGGNDNSGD